LRAAFFHGSGKPITIETIADPRPAAGQVLLRVCRCGVCGSDVTMTEGPFCYPIGQLGHEYAGEVLELGAGVTGLRVGDRVAAAPLLGCGRCEGCRLGNAIFCTDREARGFGFAELTALPAAMVIPLPRSLSLADGALIEPMACGLHALRLARLQAGARVLVIGAGAMALSAIFWACRLGAVRVVALARSTDRREVAMGAGADALLSFEEAAEPGALEAALGGPADVVVEGVGKPGLLNRAIELVRPQGTVISLGMCMQTEPMLPAACSFKEIRLYFPIGYTVAEFEETARAFDAGAIGAEAVVTDVIALEALPDLLQALRAGARSLKAQVDPWLAAANG
jgi:(R,R)-butanediol dehydrogenase/meso-butanediol dehydrogenase/diacetyl reductase